MQEEVIWAFLIGLTIGLGLASWICQKVQKWFKFDDEEMKHCMVEE